MQQKHQTNNGKVAQTQNSNTAALTQKSAPIMIRRLSLPYKLPTLTPKPNIRRIPKVIRCSEGSNTTSNSIQQITTPKSVAVPINMKLPLQKIISKIARRPVPTMNAVQNAKPQLSINRSTSNIPRISSIKAATVLNKLNGRKILSTSSKTILSMNSIPNLKTYSRQSTISSSESGEESFTLSNGRDNFSIQNNNINRLLPPLKSANSVANLM